jgi:hypothetical protein
MTTDVDLGWQDVLRRAERRAPRRRLVLLAALVTAALGGGPALGVLLTRSGPPQLARDRIVGPVSSILDPRTHLPLLEYGRWREHDGVCYLVPRTHAGCLLAGHRAGPFSVLPAFTRLRHKGERPYLLITRPRRYVVVALPGGRVKLVRP